MRVSLTDREYLKQLTLLYVEDDSETMKQFSELFARLAGVLITAENGAEGLKAYRERKPDIIITDVQMPVMDGLQMLQEIRAVDKSIPVIVLTAFEEAFYLKRSINLGASGYVNKPVELEKLLEALFKSAHTLLVEEMSRQTVADLERRVDEEVRKGREKDRIILHHDKLASVGLLAAGVAHEINNPLGFIVSNLGALKGYVDNLGRYTLQLQTFAEEKCCEEELSELREACGRLDIAYILEDIPVLISESSEGAAQIRRIVMDLKDFTRIDPDRFVKADINHCVQSSANIVRNQLQQIADLELHLGKIPPVSCNPQQISQVITNLLINASQAIEGYGRITVGTSIENNRVLLSVADTGCGIPHEIRDKIFDPFFTTKDVGKGTGLGLSICYDIVKKHGGEISLESESGKGSNFTVSLPVNQEAENRLHPER